MAVENLHISPQFVLDVISGQTRADASMLAFEINLSPLAPCYASLSSDRYKSLARANSAIFLVCFTLINLGYFLGITKSILIPRQIVHFLGFLVDSVCQSFLLIEEKKQKFLSLFHHVLHSDATDVKTLQRLSDKCISFSLAIPGTRLFLNEVYNAIGKGLRYGSSKLIPISRPLREELQQWLFLESWSGCLPWRQGAHCQVKLCTDASSFAWGCVFGPDAFEAVIRDFWPVDQHHLHINVKEALALANALDAFSSSLRDSWVDVYTDSQVLIASWRRQVSKSRDLADVFKRIFYIFSTYNIHLNLFYISSADNPADTPSRAFLLQDSKLSPFAGTLVQAELGGRSGHSEDLMALPSNLQCALDGSPLPFFSPYPIPGSSGVNLFAQRPDNHACLFSNPYVFPPIVLIPQVLCFVKTHGFACNIVISDVRPRKFGGGLFFNRIRLSCLRI